MDKSELIAEIVTRTKYDDFVNRFSVAIVLAERFIENTLRVSKMIENSVIVLASGIGALPVDLLSIISVKGNGNYPALQYQKHIIDEDFINGFYTENGNIIYKGMQGFLKLEYYKKIPSLNTNVTNWLLETNPSIYMSALMMQAYEMQSDIDNAVKFKEYLDLLIRDYQNADNINNFAGRTGVYK